MSISTEEREHTHHIMLVKNHATRPNKKSKSMKSQIIWFHNMIVYTLYVSLNTITCGTSLR